MPITPIERLPRFAKAAAIAAAAWICQGLSCSERQDPPSLASAVLTEIHLVMAEPATGAPGVYLAWRYPEDGRVSYFDVYSSPAKDSLGHPVFTQLDADAMHAVLPLPDSSRPFTLYFAVRPVFVEATGQKLTGDTLVVDSLSITPSLEILQPAPGSHQPGRTLHMEVLTTSDAGVMLRIGLFEKPGNSWNAALDTCLPLGDCQTPILGRSLQKDSLVLAQGRDGDTTQALFCVVGTESFEGNRTGLLQSLGCSRFFRVGP